MLIPSLAHRLPGHRRPATARPDLPGQRRHHAKTPSTAGRPGALLRQWRGQRTPCAAFAGAHATQAFEDSRLKVSQWLNAGNCGQVVFTHGATSALNLLAYGLEHLFNPGDEIVISALEHHANLLPWQQLAERRSLTLVVLPLDVDGVIDSGAAAELIGPRTRLLAVSQLSNVLGPGSRCRRCWRWPRPKAR